MGKKINAKSFVERWWQLAKLRYVLQAERRGAYMTFVFSIIRTSSRPMEVLRIRQEFCLLMKINFETQGWLYSYSYCINNKHILCYLNELVYRHRLFDL